MGADSEPRPFPRVSPYTRYRGLQGSVGTLADANPTRLSK